MSPTVVGATHVTQIPLIPPAREADPRRVHSLLVVRAPSDRDQPLSVSPTLDVRQGTRGGDRGGGGRRCE